MWLFTALYWAATNTQLFIANNAIQDRMAIVAIYTHFEDMGSEKHSAVHIKQFSLHLVNRLSGIKASLKTEIIYLNQILIFTWN